MLFSIFLVRMSGTHSEALFLTYLFNVYKHFLFMSRLKTFFNVLKILFHRFYRDAWNADAV